MTTNKLIGKLLKFKGLKVVNLSFKKGSNLEIAVKPFKHGCRCQQCGRRGKIMRTRPELIQIRGHNTYFSFFLRPPRFPIS
ncbi:hypothetical protein MNBD_GAMMA26-658 [hydrothermal vent metagenome]|uniref:Transposase IS204/IS1001/IS1096/IS1165 zinc-finger domain-containing protein n=1 Tax=hydrothermal vent metagenome TaxID=652676 RepID=A0A3B1AJB2_9ZZZZ